MAAIADSFALVLTGGGARAAYQVGVLRCLAKYLPKDSFDVITGVSAGAINAAFLASRNAPLTDVIEELGGGWRTLTLKDVIRIDARSLARNVFGWGGRLVSGGTPFPVGRRGGRAFKGGSIRRLFGSFSNGSLQRTSAGRSPGSPRTSLAV